METTQKLPSDGLVIATEMIIDALERTPSQFRSIVLLYDIAADGDQLPCCFFQSTAVGSDIWERPELIERAFKIMFQQFPGLAAIAKRVIESDVRVPTITPDRPNGI